MKSDKGHELTDELLAELEAKMSKTLSIITNFGCHYQCPYCIVKNNNMQIPKTTIAGLNNLKKSIVTNQCDIVSVSGGGDPLFEYEKHIEWWNRLKTILSELKIPLEIHTSYTNSGFSLNSCQKIVYHLREKKQILDIKRIQSERVRVVFVITEKMTRNDVDEIYCKVKQNPNIDQLSFRQRIDKNYVISYHLHDYLKSRHGIDWWYIEQNDYNLYYAEGKVYKKYADFNNNQ